MSRTGALNFAFWAATIVVVGGLEISGRLTLGPTVALGATAVVLLPGALVAMTISRGTTAPGLAVSDVWHISTRGRLPDVDAPASGLRPLLDPAPDGAHATARRAALPRTAQPPTVDHPRRRNAVWPVLTRSARE